MRYLRVRNFVCLTPLPHWKISTSSYPGNDRNPTLLSLALSDEKGGGGAAETPLAQEPHQSPPEGRFCTDGYTALVDDYASLVDRYVALVGGYTVLVNSYTVLSDGYAALLTVTLRWLTLTPHWWTIAPRWLTVTPRWLTVTPRC